MTLTSIKKNLPQKEKQKKKPKLDWLPGKYQDKYESTDLLYSYCIELFARLEAAKRDNIPETTMRTWFIEFIRMGWTQKMVAKRFNVLLRSPKYGAIDLSDWVNAVPVYGEDEVMRIVKDKINEIKQRGKYLLEHKEEFTVLTTEDIDAIEVALEKELSFALMNEKMKKIDEYKEKRRAELLNNKK